MANLSAQQQLSANLPAPKTFAPSREDVLSTLGFFFGDPAVPEKLKDYSEHHAMYAPRRKRPVCGSARLYCIKKLTRIRARFFPPAGPTTFRMVRTAARQLPRTHSHLYTHTQTDPRRRLPPRIHFEQPSTARTRTRRAARVNPVP